jgi:hypothetical protein
MPLILPIIPATSERTFFGNIVTRYRRVADRPLDQKGLLPPHRELARYNFLKINSAIGRQVVR